MVVGFAASVLATASQAGELLALADGQQFQVVRILPYAMPHVVGSAALSSWNELLAGEGALVISSSNKKTNLPK